MEAFNQLRQAARARRDALVIKARDECEATLKTIAALEQGILGRNLSSQRSLTSCVTNVMPADGTFTCQDILDSLEALEPRRAWRKRALDACIARLRSRGLIVRVSRARAGAAHQCLPAVYVRAGVEVEAGPFNDTPFVEVLYQVLRGESMTLTELMVAILEAGYRTQQTAKSLRQHAGRAMRKDSRFHAAGGKWSCQ